jgi:methionine--tRNA ligase beta chain
VLSFPKTKYFGQRAIVVRFHLERNTNYSKRKTYKKYQMIIMSEEKPIITFDDFIKLDIRIGTVIEAEKVPNSLKLLKLIIDFGDFKRQILAGIATKYSPEDLLNKQIPVIVNLAPRKMAGLESQGMIMAIGDGDVEALLLPTEAVKSGSSVH